MKNIVFILLSFGLAQEMEVDGNLTVTDTIYVTTIQSDTIDSLNQRVINLELIIAQLQSQFEGTALSFDGMDDYIEIPNNNNNLESFTFSIWFFQHIDQPYHQSTLINFGDLNGGIRIRLDNDKKIRLIQTGIESCESSETEVEFGEWNHLLLEFDNENISYVINGIIEPEKTCHFDNLNLIGVYSLGQTPFSTDENFYGYMNEFKHWNGVASYKVLEIFYNFNQVFFSDDILLDNSENGNDGIIHGATWIHNHRITNK